MRLIGLAALLVACNSTRDTSPAALDPPSPAAVPTARSLTASASASEIPVLLQTEATDCDPAALTMTLNYYGRRMSLDAIKAAMQFRSGGSSALDIVQVTEANGRAVVGVGAGADESLPGLQRGDILHVDMDHFVVVDRVSPGTIQILDSARGRVTLDHACFVRRYSQVALLFAFSLEALEVRKKAIGLPASRP